MTTGDSRHRDLERRTAPVTMLMMCVLLVLFIQLWLVTIALEEHLAAHSSLAVPTFLASGGCFLLNLWLLRYLYRVERGRKEG
ncbi:MAG: hypothetical protein IT208_10240 [Chthonomonadales bacterium]|nr:hypothetical protein [Chthonomonadales bacterium]